jgi:uncharacterized protein (TIGR00369 family)
MTGAEFEAIAKDGVPFAALLEWRVERFAPGDVRVRLPHHALLLRPGGTICGPALMALADITLWGLVMSRIGRVDLAVTTEMTIHFLARPAPADVLAQGRVLRQGRRLVVGEVVMRSEAEPGQPICHVVGTYALPPAIDRAAPAD